MDDYLRGIGNHPGVYFQSPPTAGCDVFKGPIVERRASTRGM